MQAGHVLIDGEGLFLSVDRGFGAIMQAPPTRLIGRSVDALTAPADREECCRAITDLRTTRTPFEITKRFLRDDGSLVWVTNTVSMVENGRDPDLMVATVVPVLEPQELRAPALLLDCARLMMALRRERSSLFDTALFTDRAWDVMLLAYIAEAEGRAIDVASLAADQRMAPAQAERWIAALLGNKVIEIETRQNDPFAPKGFRLTSVTHARLEEYLSNASQLQGARPAVTV